MTHPDDINKKPSDLRKRAEASLLKRPSVQKNVSTLSCEEVTQLVHEMSVHQIELEMQNEELREAQNLLSEFRGRLSDVCDCAPAGYFTFGKDGLILKVNLIGSALLAADRSSLIGKRFQSFLVEGHADAFCVHEREVFKARTKQRCEIKIRKSDGATFDAQLESLAMEDRDGRVTRYRAIVSDITERKRAEKERLQLAWQLQQVQKAESLGRMAGAIAHHFNNQLGAGLGNLELALIQMSQGLLPHENITEAIKAFHRLAQVSGQMLTYLGQTPGKREPLDLSEVCRRSLPMLQAVISKIVFLDHNLPSLGPTVSAKVNQRQQVLTNLITNAWEAVGDDPGAIHLTVKTVPSRDIPVTHRFSFDWEPQANTYACLEVTDTECGIADKDIEKVFHPFFSTKFTGRGQGLSVILGIVRVHGGVITVEGETARGSVFQVFLPMSAEELASQQDQMAKTPEVEGDGTVLLVEDEDVVRNMVRALLSHLGFAVLAAKDGVEALEVFRQRKDEIRCVLCDLTMPRMNGRETLEALRALRPDIPVVLASGYDEAKGMQGDHPELPQAFLYKPYRMMELKAALGVAMGSPSAESMKRDEALQRELQAG
jgi:two-component system, cell cycle sensor histidine kinase and response regulator CckA